MLNLFAPHDFMVKCALLVGVNIQFLETITSMHQSMVLAHFCSCDNLSYYVYKKN